MELIDKNRVITEINRVLNSYDPNEITSGRYALVDLRNFINTLEVKEVDLEKETLNKELADEIDALSKRYPEISFAKLSRIAVRVAKWQKEQDKKGE